MERRSIKPRRKGWRRAVVGLILCAVVGGAAFGGWVWWSRPSTRSVSLPSDVKKGDRVRVAPNLPGVWTENGGLRMAKLRSEGHEWIVTLEWSGTGPDGKGGIGKGKRDVRLGRTFRIKGFGTVTVLKVEPASLFGGGNDGGPPRAILNLVTDPGLTWSYGHR